MPNLESFEAHQEIARLKADLKNLPDVPVDDAVWLSVEPEVATPERAWWLRQPSAMAASVLVFTAALVFFVGNQMVDEGPAYNPTTPLVSNTLPNTQLTALMDRSQQLEALASATPGWGNNELGGSQSGLNMSPLAQMILFELVRVDAEIEAAGLTVASDNVAPGTSSREQDLWQRRVNLLQAFIAEVEHANPGSFDNDRSM